jgi:hypothetical protein
MPSEIAEMLERTKLTNKQRRFVLAYLRYLNGSKAARIAGYSLKCAHQQAYENQRKPKIRRIIDKGIELGYTVWAVDPAVIDDVGGRESDKC